MNRNTVKRGAVQLFTRRMASDNALTKVAAIVSRVTQLISKVSLFIIFRSIFLYVVLKEGNLQSMVVPPHFLRGSGQTHFFLKKEPQF